MRIYVGIDNGTSGTIGIIKENGDYEFHHTPSKIEQSYTKTKQNISRVDYPKLLELLSQFKDDNVKVMIERPMINPKRFKASMSAIRALESTLIALEELNYSYEYADSRLWQRKLLPSGIKGSDDLKKASKDIGSRLFPKESNKFKKDADGLLIAEYLRQMSGT